MEKLLLPEVQAFIRAHAQEDVPTLALQAAKYPDLPFHAILDQIRSLQKARHKLPEWVERPGIIFPAPISMEQCSSPLTAAYKAENFPSQTVLDLTGGAGVDTMAFAEKAEKVTYVERDNGLAQVASHNFKTFGHERIQVVCTDAKDFLSHSKGQFDLIYLDPARRDEAAGKVHRLEDCSPDVLELLPALFDHSPKILLKASPMLDISQAIRELKGVTEVHVLAVQNECKELLFLLGKQVDEPVIIKTVNFQKEGRQVFDFEMEMEQSAEVSFGEMQQFLYEPNAAIMKAGGFRLVAQRLGLTKLHPHTHLYTSAELVPEFPGRSFEVLCRLGSKPREVKRSVPTMKANVAVRNYPLKAPELKKRLGLRDGGDDYVFGYTDLAGMPKVVLCRRVG